MKIKSVDIEGMHNVESAHYDIDAATYVYGPNGSGKSTILEAISWAILGYIPRTNKTSSAIFKHSNCDKMQVSVQLEDASGQSITVIRALESFGSSPKESITTVPANVDLKEIVGQLELPILNFSEFLGMTANKQKELIMSILPGVDQQIDTRNLLKSEKKWKSSFEDYLDELVGDFDVLDSIETIKSYNAYLKELQSQYVAEEKRITATTQQLIFYDDYEGEADVEALKQQINEVLQHRDQALKAEMQQQNYESQKAQLEAYAQLADSYEADTEVESWVKDLAEAQANLENRHIKLNELRTELAAIDAEIANCDRVISSHGICPFIEDNCERIEAEINKLENTRASRLADKEDVQLRIKNTQDNIDGLNSHISQVESKLAVRKSEYEKRDNLKAMIQEPTTCEYTSEFCTQLLQKLNDDLVKAAANEKYNELTETLTKEKLQVTSIVEFIKAIVKRTGENGLQSEIMQQPFERLAEGLMEVQQELKLDQLGAPHIIIEAKANSFDFGFVRNEIFIPFALLSSGEKCAFTLMFMIALLKVSQTDIEFIMVDDLLDHLDDNRFTTIIDNISKLSNATQLIFAGVKPIQSTAVTLIDLGTRHD